MKRTTISINEDVINYLDKYGKYKDTPNDIILRTFQENEQLKQEGKSNKKKEPKKKIRVTTEQEDIEK